MSEYNPHITIESPFPEQEYPSVFFWMQKFWDKVAIDDTPDDLDGWMDVQLTRVNALPPQIVTWGVYRDGELGGYIEMVPHVAVRPADTDYAGTLRLMPELDLMAEAHAVFKKDFWGHRNTQTAVNLALQQMFAIHGIEMMFLPVFSHNRAIIALLKSVGAKDVGLARDRVMQQGKSIDLAVFCLLKDEWVEANSAWMLEYAEAHRAPEDTESPEPAPLGLTG